MQQIKATVSNRTMLLTDVCILELKAPALAAKSQPGQFVQVDCGGGIYSLLRRPFSVHRVENETAALLFQVKGEGTRWLAARKAGDVVDLLGPLGRGFHLPSSGQVVLVAGGLGLAPLFFLSQQAIARDLKVTLLLGASDASRVLLAEELEQIGVEIFLATEDGSLGHRGLVTEVLADYLERKRPAGIYACGPEPMLARVAELGLSKGVPTQLSLEARMACGVGACRGCVARIRRGGRITYENVCSKGPVFAAEEVVFSD